MKVPIPAESAKSENIKNYSEAIQPFSSFNNILIKTTFLLQTLIIVIISVLQAA